MMGLFSAENPTTWIPASGVLMVRDFLMQVQVGDVATAVVQRPTTKVPKKIPLLVPPVTPVSVTCEW